MGSRSSIVAHRAALAALAFSVIASCEAAAPLTFRASTPCGMTGRTFELWCDDAGNCEYRVIGTGGVYRCAAGDMAGCTAAGEQAATECLEGRPDGGVDGASPDVAPPCTPTTELDLLLVVDNSGSMGQEQALFLGEMASMLSALAPLASLHVGVVTTDLGAGAIPADVVVPSCDAGFGDDGILRDTSTGGGGCAAVYPSRIFEVDRGEPSTDLATAITCVGNLGTSGCGFEQQLEVPLKALSPTAATAGVASGYAPPSFAEGGTGHGDGANAGFLRPGAVLAIMIVSDEEDCSVPSYDLFYQNDPDYIGEPLNLRCSRFDDEALYPVSRYVDGLLQLRERPSQLVFVPVVGIPTELEGLSYEDMLDAPGMAYVEEAGPSPMRLVPSCDTANGLAYPPRRIVEVARGLRDRGASTAVVSICQPTGAGWREALVEQVSRALSCGAP